MDFKSAIKLSKESHSSLESEGKQIIGISYNSNTNDIYERFEFFSINYNLEDFQESGVDWFDIYCNGEPEWGGECADALLLEIPEEAKDINYHVFKVESLMMLEIWYILKLIFPELPDQGSSDFISDLEFEKRALILINNLGDKVNT